MNIPIPEAYWVIPGRLLAGPYPGSRDEEAARQRIQRFLDAGVSFFLDLTEEGEAPPYTPLLDGSAQYLRIPIPDSGALTPEQMARILDVIDWAVGMRRLTYVHCQAGLGRTGMVVGCFLTRHGLSGLDALKALIVLRADTPHSESASPETELQQGMVLAWEKGQ